MSVPARAERAPETAAGPAPSAESVEALLESRPELAQRIGDGDLTALAEFFELRGSPVTSIRYVEESSRPEE